MCHMREQLRMQREDYELAFKSKKLFLCNACNALTISTCEDVKKGECFYCGSKKVTLDTKKVRPVLSKRIAEV